MGDEMRYELNVESRFWKSGRPLNGICLNSPIVPENECCLSLDLIGYHPVAVDFTSGIATFLDCSDLFGDEDI